MRGEIYWARMDPAIGSEIKKTRPALIVSNNVSNAKANTVTVVPLTKSVERVFWFEVLLTPGAFGNTDACKVKTQQIRTIDKSRLGDLMGALPPFLMVEVDRAMRRHLAL